MTAKTRAIPSLHRDSLSAKAPGQVVGASSGNVASPYCRAVSGHESITLPLRNFEKGLHRLIDLNMKKIFLSLLLFFILISVDGQLSGVYVANFRDKIEYYVTFSNDGQYYMDLLEYLTIDILDNRTISIGHYSVVNNEVILRDKIHNFQMKLVIANDTLKMEKSFCFMKDKTFKYKSSYVDMNTLNWLKNFDSVSIEKDRADYKILNQKMFPIAYQDYQSKKYGLRSFRYRLTINKDSTYSLYVENLLISDGHWNRNGVELILYDTCLKQRFYLMIGDRVLISKLLPGDYESTILQRQTIHNH